MTLVQVAEYLGLRLPSSTSNRDDGHITTNTRFEGPQQNMDEDDFEDEARPPYHHVSLSGGTGVNSY